MAQHRGKQWCTTDGYWQDNASSDSQNTADQDKLNGLDEVSTATDGNATSRSSPATT